MLSRTVSEAVRENVSCFKPLSSITFCLKVKNWHKYAVDIQSVCSQQETTETFHIAAIDHPL